MAGDGLRRSAGGDGGSGRGAGGTLAVGSRGARWIDLTHAFDETTIYWPTSPTGFQLKSLFHG